MCHTCVCLKMVTFHLFFHFNQSQWFSPTPCWFPCIVPRLTLRVLMGYSFQHLLSSPLLLAAVFPSFSSAPHTPFTLGPRAAGIIWSQLSKGKKKTKPNNTPLLPTHAPPQKKGHSQEKSLKWIKKNPKKLARKAVLQEETPNLDFLNKVRRLSR